MGVSLPRDINCYVAGGLEPGCRKAKCTVVGGPYPLRVDRSGGHCRELWAQGEQRGVFNFVPASKGAGTSAALSRAQVSSLPTNHYCISIPSKEGKREKRFYKLRLSTQDWFSLFST